MQAALTCFQTLYRANPVSISGIFDQNNVDVLSVSSLSSSVDSSLVLAEVDEGSCQSSPVRDRSEKEFRSFVETCLESLLTSGEEVGNIGHSEELLHIVETISLGVGDGEFSIDRRFSESLASHLEVSNEVVGLSCPGSGFDNFEVVRRILSLDVRVDSVLDTKTVELSLSESRPNDGLIDLDSVLLSTIDRDDVFDENVHGVEVKFILAEESERFFVETMFDGDGGDLLNVETLNLFDVTHNSTLVGSNGGEHEELLEVGVVAERR